MNDEIREPEIVSYYAPGETPQSPFRTGYIYLMSSQRPGSKLIQRWQTLSEGRSTSLKSVCSSC